MLNLNKNSLLISILAQTAISTTSFASDLPDVFAGEASSASSATSTAPRLAGSKRRASVEVASLQAGSFAMDPAAAAAPATAARPEEDEIDLSGLLGYDHHFAEIDGALHLVPTADVAAAPGMAMAVVAAAPAVAAPALAAPATTLTADLEARLCDFLPTGDLGRFAQAARGLKLHPQIIDKLSQRRAILDAEIMALRQYFSSGWLEPSPELYANLDRCCTLGVLVTLDIEPASLDSAEQLAEILARGSCLKSLCINSDLAHGAYTGNDFARAIAACPNLTNLRYLDIAQQFIGAEGIRALGHSTNLPRLVGLDLHTQEFADAGAIEVACSEAFGNLEYLCLEANQITTTGFRVIASSKHLSNLKKLKIGYNHEISADSFRAIATMTNLETLSLIGETTFNADAARIIVGMENITCLVVDAMHLDAEVMAILRTRFIDDPDNTNQGELKMYVPDDGTDADTDADEDEDEL